MKIQYKKLLNLELWHDYVLGAGDDFKELPLDYSIAEYLSLSPTQSCQKVMSQLNWVFRPSSWGGSVFSKVEKSDNDFQTAIAVEESYRLTFWLLMKDSSLANFSNISLDVPKKNLYYFSNLSKNEDSDFFYLSQPLSPYQLGQEYELGDLVIDNGKILESTKYQEFSSPTPEEDFWQTLTGIKAQYTSKKDLVNKQSSQSKFTVKNVSPGDELQIILKDENQQIVLSLEKTVPNVHQRGKDFLLDLDLSNQKPGCYQLLINEEVRDKFILVDSFAPGNKLGLVEIIINEKLENEDFKFLRKKLDTGQTVISPKSYIIRFKNRATRWRYNYDKAQNLTDFNLEEFDISEDGKKIATKKVINLYHLSKIKVESLPKTANRMLLPAPKVTFISPEFKSDHLANIFSDIYL